VGLIKWLPTATFQLTRNGPQNSADDGKSRGSRFSVLRDDLRPDIDVDVLVGFSPESTWSRLERIEMPNGLEAMFGRRVDVVEKEAIRNPFRRKAILSSREIVYSG
jgi:predicted nucleotidyltransferase